MSDEQNMRNMGGLGRPIPVTAEQAGDDRPGQRDKDVYYAEHVSALSARCCRGATDDVMTGSMRYGQVTKNRACIGILVDRKLIGRRRSLCIASADQGLH